MSDVIVENSIGRFVKAFEEGTEENLLAAAMAWHGGIQKELTGSRSGRVYRVPGTKRKYTASAPGQAPARRTGRLAQAMKFQVKDNEGLVGIDASYSKVGKTRVRVADYATMLEKGTSKMKARPYIEPAYQKNIDAIKDELTRPIGGF